jgi:tetratricopeptide (TPR) repeat protein
MPGDFRHTLAIITTASLLSGCAVSEKITSKWGRGDSETSSITALDSKSSEALKQSKDLKNPVRVHLNYAKWKEETGDLVEAEKSYRLVLHKQPGNNDAKLGLARILMHQGRNSDAGELFEAVHKQSPNDPVVLTQVGQFHAEQENWDQAIQLFQRANQLDPQNKDIHFHLGVALANVGDLRGAYTQFRTGLSERDSHFNLAKILHKRGDLTSAERHMARVLELDPEYQPAQEMMARLTHGRRQSLAQQSPPQHSRGERRAIPVSAQRSNPEFSEPFTPVFEYSEENIPPF